MRNYRSPALLRLARGKQCLLNHPQHCNRDPSTTVAAHSNELRHGKGLGIKAHDFYTVWLCSGCHSWLDQGAGSKQEKQAAFSLAHGRMRNEWRRLEGLSRDGLEANPILNNMLADSLKKMFENEIGNRTRGEYGHV